MWMTRFVLYALLILLVYRALRRLVGGILQGMGVEPRVKPPLEQGVRMVRDPVCGTFVVPTRALVLRDADGTHHFCSEKCRDSFLAQSAR